MSSFTTQQLHIFSTPVARAGDDDVAMGSYDASVGGAGGDEKAGGGLRRRFTTKDVALSRQRGIAAHDAKAAKFRKVGQGVARAGGNDVAV